MARSKTNIAGHADFTYMEKYGIRDYRGGGRSSARETAARVAASAVARKVLDGVTIRGALVQMGPHEINRKNWNWDEVENNPFGVLTRKPPNNGKIISTACAKPDQAAAR